MSCLIILLVLCNLVDEEQGQHFDTLMEKLPLPFYVRENGFADLNTAELVFTDFADHITGKDFNAVQELYGVIASVNGFHHKADFILIQIAGIVVKIVADPNGCRLFTQPLCTFEIKLNGCCRICFGEIDAFQIDKAFGCRAAGFCDTFDGDLLNKTLVVGFHCIKPVHHVIDAVRLMCCGITQRQQRIELFQPLFCLLALNRLRLVNNQNRVCFCDNVNRAAGTELIQLHVNAPRVLTFGVERLRVDNHDIDGTVRRKTVNLGELGGIVDEEADFLSIFLRKMLLRHLKGLIDALADGNARHDHDKLAPTVVLVQLVHGLDIGIGLADAGFHLNRQIIAAFQFLRGLDLIGTLHLLQIFQNQLVGQLRDNTFVAPAGEVFFIGDCLLAVASVHHVGGREVRLSGEDVNHCLCRIRLKFLVFELEFHERCSLFFFSILRKLASLHSSRFSRNFCSISSSVST